jgi:hypothetical protein
MVVTAAMQHHGDTVGSRGEYEQLASMHDPRYPTRGIDQLAHDHTQDLWVYIDQQRRPDKST